MPGTGKTACVKKVIEILNGLGERIFCVRGNCDADVDQMVLTFPICADYAIVELGGSLVYATHGHIFNPLTPPPLCKGDILLCGHTHIPAKEAHEKFIYLNPGSISLPKASSPHSYMIYEGGFFIWKDIQDGKSYDEFETHSALC